MPHPRKLGPWTATALVVGNIIGAGIFMLPRELAPYGWTAVLGWMLTVAGALCLAWMFAQLFTHLPEVGGVHGFMRLGVGPQAAFIGSWGYLVSVFAANATLAISGVEYLSRLLPTGLGPDHRLALALVSLLGVVTANLLGRGGEVQLGTTIIKLVPLVLVIGVGGVLFLTASENPLAATAPAPLHPLTVLPAMSLTLYAMTGIESAVVPADAVADAPRMVPRATMVGTALSGGIGILATCLVILLLPNATGSDAPLADFVARTAGRRTGDLVALCAVVSCIGCLNGYVLVGGELMATMATQGMLPAPLATRNDRGAPMGPHLIGAVITAVLIIAAYTATSAFAFAALITTATNITLYLLCLAASLRFLRDGRLPRSASLHIAIAGAATFSILALVGAGAQALLWGGALVALGWPLYRLATRTSASR